MDTFRSIHLEMVNEMKYFKASAITRSRTTAFGGGTLMNSQSSAYPTWAFPPKLQAAILEQWNNNEAPFPTIAASVIGALSAAIQDKVDVERIPGSRVPCSVNTWVVGGSGSRKTTIDRMLMKVFSVFEKAALEKMKPQLAAEKAKRLVWEFDLERLKKKLKGDPDHDMCAEEIQFELETLLLNEPKQSPIPKILYRDATPEAIAKGLSAWRSALLNTSEAGALLGGRTMSNLGFFSSLWDGDDLRIDRASSESYVVTGPRLTISLMVQEKTFAKFLSTQGSLSRDNGFLARFLVCYPTPLEGTRFGAFATGSWENHEALQSRLLEILMRGIPEDGVSLVRKVLTLSLDAQVALKIFSDQVEADIAPGRFLSDIKDFASKVAEHAIRLGGLFHYYEGNEGPISGDTLRRAVEICTWHMLEFKRLFAESPETPLELQDAMALERCIASFSAARPGQQWVPKKYLFTHGPNAVRKKARLDLALQVLWEQGKITVHIDKKTILVALNPYFFPAVNQCGYIPPHHPQQPPPLS
ncbi:MAG: YfjI family protein [Polaromonas sp.]|uniref:YfjI family protein n=1 Tax=Polaromonas sp. TaxID=1869339 RepID=UPI00248A4428|nr:YfjI family protein [Polaromonas sp.]MDI1269461.1 YfjI family protein [Polaromonas sp.]